MLGRAYPPRGRFIDVGGARQHIVEIPKIPAETASDRGELPLVLLHGAGCNLEDLRLALGERLAGRRRLIFVDRPGQGWSERGEGRGSTPAEQAAMLCRLLDRLGIDRAILFGHSWGGALALAFALDHPDRAAGLVLVAPPTHAHLDKLSRPYAFLAAPVLGWLFAHTWALPLSLLFFATGIRAAFAPQSPPPAYLRRSAAFLLLRPRAFLANARDMIDLQAFLEKQAARYRSVPTRTVVLVGDRDRITPPAQHAAALVQALPAGKLVMLRGFGHMPHHFVADRIADAVSELAHSAG